MPVASTPALTVAHIGAGSFSRRVHGPVLRALAQSPSRVVLAGIADIDAKRPERARAFARDFGYRQAYQDFRRMLDTVQPDVVVCIVEPRAAADVIEEIVRRRIPVFTEKPPALTLRAARHLACLAFDHRVASYVAFNRRRMPAIDRAREWMASHGPVRYVRGEMRRNRRHETRFAMATAIHVLDTLRYLAGDVLAIETRRATYGTGAGTDYHARLQFASGAAGDVTILVDAGQTQESYFIHADNSCFEVVLSDHDAGVFRRIESRGCRDGRVVCTGTDDRDGDPLVLGGFVREHEAFLDAVSTGTRIDCTLAEAQHSVHLAAALQRGHCGPLSELDAEDSLLSSTLSSSHPAAATR